jgi:hypothetical protein
MHANNEHEFFVVKMAFYHGLAPNWCHLRI